MITIPARHYRAAARRPGDVLWLVLHSAEVPFRPGAARSVAAYFARGEVEASAHYCVDAEEIVQCVDEADVAWGARGANLKGIHIELAGCAAQLREEWLADYGRAMLARAAELAAGICRRWRIPLEWRSYEGLRAGRPGLTTHMQVSAAWHKSDHWDPGHGFPEDVFLDLVLASGTPRPHLDVPLRRVERSES